MSALKYVNKLQGKRVLVIGASSGVGFCVAEAALEHGAHVTISSSNQTKLDKAASRLQEHIKAANLGDASKLLSAKTVDLGNPDTVDQSVVELLEFATKDGKLDHVVFTAGDALKTSGLKETTVKDIQAINQVRNAGAIIVAKHLHKYINPSVSSSFTLTGGTNTWRPLPNWSVVAFAGGGTESLTRGLAVDLRPVRCNCVRLGAVQTELLDMIPEEHREGVLQGFRDWAITGTVGTPQEVAEAYVYSMKDSFATGAIFTTDGGRLVGESKSLFGI
ncbi:dehyrdogenase/reductase domain-containing protein [Trichoderma citrinoviride]|uniref:Dehyrdogenase/reductase domain-containing protein n=1 Tax=Trichoderma citrinoviride TaxID=58853 RepID=A0A2T4B265_9HYPO|nr:dehyrdogenase/reductase domain-containing protein [Trichoderma citrinoviride]PTB63416.1 dehyrdogenase/reductase domain-containing protein [Trichoderma citrinoviride]